MLGLSTIRPIVATVPTELVAATARPLASSAIALPAVKLVEAATLNDWTSIPVDLANAPLVATIFNHTPRLSF